MQAEHVESVSLGKGVFKASVNLKFARGQSASVRLRPLLCCTLRAIPLLALLDSSLLRDECWTTAVLSFRGQHLGSMLLIA